MVEVSEVMSVCVDARKHQNIEGCRGPGGASPR